MTYKSSSLLISSGMFWLLHDAINLCFHAKCGNNEAASQLWVKSTKYQAQHIK